nr:proteasome subunit beta type-10 isoform X2 [Cavia porcellus]
MARIVPLFHIEESGRGWCEGLGKGPCPLSKLPRTMGKGESERGLRKGFLEEGRCKSESRKLFQQCSPTEAEAETESEAFLLALLIGPSTDPSAPLQSALPEMLKPALAARGGFCFENCQRNASLEYAFPGLRVPHARKTGTTIAGLVFRDGVILGADTRATNDTVVADKNCEKIHYIAPKIYCCGAGVAADAEMSTRMVASNMELHALSTGREPRVATVTRILRQTLFRYQGHVGASLIVGGIDLNGPQLYNVHPHGSYSRLPFVALGSGQDAALAVLEDRFQPNMTAWSLPIDTWNHSNSDSDGAAT